MSIIDSIREHFASKQQLVTVKQPSFNVTQFNSNNIEEALTPEGNYLDQYVLYTYKCIDMVSNTTASADLALKAIRGSEEVAVERDDLLNDLTVFNPWMTLWEARKLLRIHLALTGVAYWLVVREDISRKSKKAEFYPLDPLSVTMNTDSFGLPSGFVYEDADGNKNIILPENMIYFRNINPKNWIEGYSQVEAIKYLHNAFDYATQHNMNVFANGGRPDFLLKIPGIEEEQRQVLERMFREKYQGVGNARKPGVLTSESVEVLDLTRTQKDLDYVEGIKLLRQDIMAMFGVPEALIFPSATNSNTKEARRIFQRDTITPLLKQEEAVLNEQVIPKYYNTNITKADAYFFDFENVVDEDKEETAVMIEKLSKVITINEAREMLGKDPIEDGDRLVTDVPANSIVQPLDEQVAQDNEDSSKDLQKLFDARFKSLEEKIVKATGGLTEREILRQKATNDAIEYEKEMQPVVNDWFYGQAKRIVERLKDKTPALSKLFKMSQENTLAEQHFKNIYENISSEVNEDLNIEVKTKLFKAGNSEAFTYRHKSISLETLNELNKRLSIFSNEINETTREKLAKAITDFQGDQRALQQSVADIFNGYIEGQGNIDTLKRYGVYIENIAVNTEGSVVISSKNRYNAMLERISNNLTGEDQTRALTALKGIVDTGDPVGSSVNVLLTNIYGIKEADAITDYRAAMIARTESNAIRNMTLREGYEQNEYVKKLEWVAALDSATRPAHAAADGDMVPKGTAFVVGGEKLMYPGDRNGSAANTINCRCRTVAVVE